MTKWVITSAWPYASDVPHLGNMIGSILSADVFARFQRLIGNQVVFVSGSDEHGAPLEVEAIRRNMPVKQLADANHAKISEIFRRWNISYDNYTRTEAEAHKRFVRQLYSDIQNNNSYIFTQEEMIHYCPKDKRFLPDRFVEGTCPYCGFDAARGDQCDKCDRPLDAERLTNAYCVICKSATQLKATTQWFFDLPRLADYVSEYLSRAELSSNVVRFSKGWIKDGLRPRSITRDSEWGIRAPFPGAENKTIYVWMEAVLGYVSAVIEYFEKLGAPEMWKEYWLDSRTKTSFFIGKDNIPFHSIILPSLLRASGTQYNEPNLISSTEFLNFENQKFSKSRKIGIWTDEALDILPADFWRFSLIALRPEASDVNFGWDSLTEKVNNDLNDAIGNFVHRTLVGVAKFAKNVFDFRIQRDSYEFHGIVSNFVERHDQIFQHYAKVELQSTCRLIVEQAFEANKFLSATEPWKTIKSDREKTMKILYVALTALKLLTCELCPIIPETSASIISQAGIFKKTNGSASWTDISLETDFPISPRGIKPIFFKVNSEELRMKLETLRSSK